MSTSGWFRPAIGRTTLPNRSMNPQSLKLRTCFIEYPLASKIIVRNLSYTTSENCLKEEFSNFGQIAEGYAFVQYMNQDDAMSALEAMDEKYLDGRVVYVELAKPMDKRTAFPKTSGPPQESPYLGQEQAEN